MVRKQHDQKPYDKLSRRQLIGVIETIKTTRQQRDEDQNCMIIELKGQLAKVMAERLNMDLVEYTAIRANAAISIHKLHDSNDKEKAYDLAVEILCEMLRLIGFDSVAEQFEKLERQ